MTERHTGNCRYIKVPEPRVYRVTVTDPDGNFMERVISEDQVKFVIVNEHARPFSTATWLAYCDLWVNEP